MLNGEILEIECDLEMLFLLRSQVNSALWKHPPDGDLLQVAVL